ncbi:hypothetical protein PMIN03_011592 [Paraphaeosphaeria minitans]
MDDENAAGNVWADASHDLPDDSIGSPTLSSHQILVKPSAGFVKQTTRTDNTADDDQPVAKKSNSGRKIYKARKTVGLKAWRARYTLFAVFGFVCWLVLTLLTVQSAATGVIGILMPSYRTTTHRLSNIKSGHSLVLSKFEDLKEIRLQRRPFETHPKCLTRATNIVQDHYDDLPYQSYPLVAEYTSQWAQAECDKIILSPVLIPRSGWHHFWMALSDGAGAVFFRCKDMVDGLIKAKKQRSQKSSNNTQNVALSLPSWYQLDCNDTESFCHLLIVPLHSVTTHHNRSTEEKNLIIEGRQLFQIIDGCKRVKAMMAMAWWLVPWMNLMALVLQIVTYGAVALMDEVSDTAKKVLGLKMFRYSLAFYLSEGLLMSMYFWHEQYADKDNFSRTITMTAYTIHLGPILLCCAELSAAWRFRAVYSQHLLWAVQDVRTAYYETSEETIRKIIMEYDGTTETKEEGSVTSDVRREFISKQTAVVEGNGADDASTLPKLHISPGSPFFKDVKLIREHLHRNQALPGLQTQSVRPQAATIPDFAGGGFSISPTSDSGWSAFNSSEDEAFMLQKTDDLPNDKDLADDAAEPGNAIHEEPAEDDDDLSTLCYCSVCGVEDVKGNFLRCVNGNCPFACYHHYCASIIETGFDMALLCPMCGEP